MSSGRVAEAAAKQVDGRTRRLLWRLAAAGLLLLAFGLMASSAVRKSATVDEQSHLFRGVAYMEEGATQFRLGHPVLGGTLSALPLLTETEVRLPVDTQAWEAGDWSVAGDQFLWRLNEEPLRLIFLGRLAVVWLTLMLGALVFRWAAEWAGPAAGALAMALTLLDPNVLAHGRFITGDLPVALFFTLALYGYWRWAQLSPADGHGRWKRKPLAHLLLSGAGLGLAAATKFNAALLGPILLLWGVVLAWRQRSWRPLLALVVVGLAGWLAIWAVYGFALWRGVLPGGAFWDDVLWQLRYVGQEHGVYLLGQVSPRGWLAYFPIAYGLKTPLLTLAMLVLSLIAVIRQRADKAALFLVAPAVIYFAGSMMVALNIGYRYLLPMVPLVSVLIGTVVVSMRPVRRRPTLWAAALIGLAAITALWVWPDYVPYFNALAGRESWRILSDSNVDWGQDLMALARWQKEQGTRVKLSYFGTAHPSAYGLSFEPLPTWAPGPEQGEPGRQAYYPPDPAPGTYAISVTNLHGVVLGEGRDSFDFFRELVPVAKIGGSIHIYQVEGRGEPVDVAFSGLVPDDLEPAIHERFGTNDVRARWLDAGRSMVLPAVGGWLVSQEALEPLPSGSPWMPPTSLEITAEDQLLYRLPPAPELNWAGGGVEFGEPLTFLGVQGLQREGQVITLTTAWRVKQATERPLKLFVHALDETGQIIGQWDGVDVDPGSWRAGDVLVQAHEFLAPAEVQSVEISIGVYDGVTGERLGEPVRFALDDR